MAILLNLVKSRGEIYSTGHSKMTSRACHQGSSFTKFLNPYRSHRKVHREEPSMMSPELACAFLTDLECHCFSVPVIE